MTIVFADSADDERFGLTATEHRRLADILIEAARSRRSIEPLSRRYPELTVGDAGRIRDALLMRRLAAGERLVGATASFAGHEPGSRRPAWRLGWITNGMLIATTSFMAGALIRPRAVATLAFRLARGLDGPRVSHDGMLAAVDRVLPTLAVLDGRYDTADITAADAIADNCAIAGVRAGAGGAPASLRDATRLECTVAGAPGGPQTLAADVDAPSAIAAIVWLAQRMIDAGRAPPAGTLLVASAHTTAVDLRSGTRLRAAADGLGTVELRSIPTRPEEPGHDH